jgi:hypothetical protein
MNATLKRPEVDSITGLPEGTLETCDTCGVPAKYRVNLPSGLQLTFCGHHANKLFGPATIELLVQGEQS